MGPCELTASITAIANALACKLTVDELTLLGSAFSQFGDTLTTIAVQKSICKSIEERTSNHGNNIPPLGCEKAQ